MAASTRSIAELPCPLCGGRAHVLYAGHPGYQEPSTYDIAACENCNTAFALPLEIDTSLYQLIYRQRARLRGYEEYVKYAKEVLRQSDPLAYLAGEQETYWAIDHYLRAVNRRPPRQMIELGSGLGYLTYALTRRGYDAIGLDIAPNAVAEARAAYGEHYLCADLFQYARENAASRDVVIMTELIEHVPDPLAFLAAAKALLRQGGDIVLTTPNRTSSPAGMLWNTDSPPVHLWWFSEDSIRWLAQRLGMSVRFVDFSGFSRRHGPWPVPPAMAGQPTVWPAMDAQGRPLDPVEPNVPRLRAFARRCGVKYLRDRWRLYHLRYFAEPSAGARRGSLCAILSLTTSASDLGG